MLRRKYSLLILIIIALFISYHIYYQFVDNEDNIVVEEYQVKEEISPNNVEKIIKKEDTIIGILEIPKIKLKKGFYDINSEENNVDKNIMVLKGSNMPDELNGSMFLASHSGNSRISYFRNLDKLEIDDQIIITYQNKKYYYTVSDIYEITKDGKINVNKNIHETILVLTTCSKDDSKQLVVKSKLIKAI